MIALNHLPEYFPQMKISLPEQFNLYMFWLACVSDLLSMYLVGMHLHAIISEHVHTVIRKNKLSGMYNEKQSAALYHARNCTLTTSRQLNMFV